MKREGDGATPVGSFALRQIRFRRDRVVPPRTGGLSTRALRPDDGWCDSAVDRNYNRHVRHPYPASAERMWREDGLYDFVVVTGHNERPRSRGRGSAIFMHVASGRARHGFKPTEGCVALERHDIAWLIAHMGLRTRLVVRP